MIKEFLFEEDGLGTVEMLLILAGLVSVAIIFKKQLVGFVRTTTGNIFGNQGAAQGTGVVTQ